MAIHLMELAPSRKPFFEPRQAAPLFRVRLLISEGVRSAALFLRDLASFHRVSLASSPTANEIVRPLFTNSWTPWPLYY